MVVVFWTLCWASEKDGRRGGMVQERRGGGFTTIKGMKIETESRLFRISESRCGGEELVQDARTGQESR